MRLRAGRSGAGGRLISRVVVAATVLLATLGAAFGLSLAASDRLATSARQHERANAAADRGVQALKLVLDVQTGERGYLITGDERFLDPWRAARPALPRALSELERAAVRVGEERAAQQFRMESLRFVDFSERVVATARRDLESARSIVATGEGKRRVDQLRTLLDQIARRARRMADADAAAAESASRRATRVQTAGLAVSAGLLLSFIGYLAVALLAPVRRTAAAARALRSGDLATRLERPRTRELAQLVDAFNEMATALEANAAELRKRHEELDAARREADAANLAKSDFLSRMSHELRTPLNAILGFGQILEMDALDPDQRQSTDHIMKAGHHLLELINEVLDIARIESGELKVSLEPVSVAELLREALAMIAPLATARTVTIHSDPDSCADRHVFADRQRLKQVMLNLLSNAVKYNRDDGAVHVGCESAGDERLRIIVADTGIGIAEHDLARLFRPFERLRPEDSKVEGTGLGLALTKRLAEAMGGEIHVDSEIGQGSVFSVELALVEARAKPSAQMPVPAAAAAPEPGLAPQTVLYVEDNASNVKLIEAVLARRSNVTLMVAIQGRLGLELAVEHQPSLVLLDLDLPDMPGDEVLRRLRADRRTAQTRIVIVSADATPRQIERLKGLGANDYLSKPFDVARLLAVIDARETDAGAGEGSAATQAGVSALDPTFLRELSAMRGASTQQREAVDELVRLFVSEGEERLDALRSAAARHDLDDVARLAHALAGTSSSVGAFRLSEACRELEHDARDGNADVEVRVARLAPAFADATAALSGAFPGSLQP